MPQIRTLPVIKIETISDGHPTDASNNGVAFIVAVSVCTQMTYYDQEHLQQCSDYGCTIFPRSHSNILRGDS